MAKAATTNRKPPRTKRISCYEGWKSGGLNKNLAQAAAGYRKAGLPGMAMVVNGVRDDAHPDMTFSDLMELQDTAMVVCVNAVFVLAELGLPEWIKRRETHLKRMEAVALDPNDPRAAKRYAKHAAAIRKAMKFADGPPPKAKRARKTK